MTNTSSRKDAKAQRKPSKTIPWQFSFFQRGRQASGAHLPCTSCCLLGVFASLRDKHILTQRRKEKHKSNTVAVLIFSTQTAGVGYQNGAVADNEEPTPDGSRRSAFMQTHGTRSMAPYLPSTMATARSGSDPGTLVKRLEPMIQMNVLPEIPQTSGQDKRRNPENDGHYD